MPRFYFDLYGGEYCRDDKGLVLPGIEAAQPEALNALQKALLRSRKNLWDQCAVEVRNGDGNIVFRASVQIKVRSANGVTALPSFLS